MNEIKNTNTKNSLSRNDLLAVVRTNLANERTLLAYIRTSTATLAGGLSLIQFFEYPIFIITGYVLIPLGFLILIFGVMRWSKSERKITKIITDECQGN